MIDNEHRGLSIVLLITGVAFILVYPMMALLPGSWGWEPPQYEYEQMIQGIYFVLGIFTIIAARNPVQHLGLVWFIAISSIVHGGIMMLQALADPTEYANFYGDIPALIIAGALIAWLAPKRLTPPREETGATR